MKLFLCAFEQLFLGIPSSCAAEIISLRRGKGGLTESGAPRGDTPSAEGVGPQPAGELHISLPALLGRPNVPALHGIVLKDIRPKTILLVPPIDMDKEIPDEQIHPLPELLRGMLPFAGGICFIREGIVLSLDPGLLTEKIESLPRGASQ